MKVVTIGRQNVCQAKSLKECSNQPDKTYQDILEEVERHKEVLFAQKCSEVLDKGERIEQFAEEVAELLMMTPDFKVAIQ